MSVAFAENGIAGARPAGVPPPVYESRRFPFPFHGREPRRANAQELFRAVVGRRWERPRKRVSDRLLPVYSDQREGSLDTSSSTIIAVQGYKTLMEDK